MSERNPFLIGNDLNPIASLNRLVIKKLPSTFQEKDIVNKSSYDLFSLKQIIKEIESHRTTLGIPFNMNKKEYPMHLIHCLNSSDERLVDKALEIIEKYGRRLGMIFLTLSLAEEENRLGRTDWTHEHWTFWQNIHTIFLVGGLASGRLGELFKRHIENVFEEANKQCFQIVTNKQTKYASLLGCARNSCEDGTHVVFDFGQSYIKRAIVYSNQQEVTKISILKNYQSLFLDTTFSNSNDEKRGALDLNNYIRDGLVNTIKEANGMNIHLGSEIIISIANYIVEGKFFGRGGYAKLGLLSESYEEDLANQISNLVDKKYKIKFIHDGTAASHAFNEVQNSACISLGTAFGVGFSTNQILPKRISTQIEIEESL